jgi:hypothetical protein
LKDKKKTVHGVIPLGSYEILENWCTDSLALWKDVNELLPIFSIFFSGLEKSVFEISVEIVGLF